MSAIFPIFRSFYDDNPVGTVRITNSGKEQATDIKVSFVIRQYMDAPKECAVIKRLGPGESADVKLYGLFNDRILSVTKSTKVTSEVTAEYGSDGAQTKTAIVLVYDRDELAWNDDGKAAAKDDYLPGIVNRGNIAYMKADLKGAYKYFQQAAALNPDNPRLLLNIARTAQAMGNWDEVASVLEPVKKLDPTVAERYLASTQTGSGGTRAAEANMGAVEWF